MRQLHEVIVLALVVHTDAVNTVAIKVTAEHVRVCLERRDGGKREGASAPGATGMYHAGGLATNNTVRGGSRDTTTLFHSLVG